MAKNSNVPTLVNPHIVGGWKGLLEQEKRGWGRVWGRWEKTGGGGGIVATQILRTCTVYSIYNHILLEQRISTFRSKIVAISLYNHHGYCLINLLLPCTAATNNYFCNRLLWLICQNNPLFYLWIRCRKMLKNINNNWRQSKKCFVLND